MISVLKAVASAVFNGRLSHSAYGVVSSSNTIDLRALARLEPLSLRLEVLQSVATSIQASCGDHALCRNAELVPVDYLDGLCTVPWHRPLGMSFNLNAGV